MTESDNRRAEHESEEPQWEASKIMRERADASRQERDAAIADLRGEMSDEEVLDELGIDLGQIEDEDDGRRGR